MNWEDYVIGESNVLKNKLGITNLEELKKRENEIVVAKLSLLYLEPIKGKFDYKHLKELHRFLFSDLYEFAGNYREVEIFKITDFVKPKDIHQELVKTLAYYRNLSVDTTNKFTIAKVLGEFYRELIRIHPFREGNGRTIREFLRQFVSYKFPDYKLNYANINKKNFLLGILEPDTYPSLLAYEIYNALDEVNIKTK